jgi:prepilin-type N-terminal cleavage/methylation domain-containing protein
LERRAERGLTLIEVTIVTALAAVVMMGLISFYIGSQTMWMQGSTQALAQRDATLLVETLSDSVHQYAHAQVVPSPDTLHETLILFDHVLQERCRFWWDPNDSLIHRGPGLGQDLGPVVASRVTRFQLDTLLLVVEYRLIELRTTGGLVRIGSAAALQNRGFTP